MHRRKFTVTAPYETFMSRLRRKGLRRRRAVGSIVTIVLRIGNRLRLLREYARSVVRARAVGQGAIGLLCKTDQGLFCVDPADLHVGWSLQANGAWDPEILAELEGLLTPDSRVLVLGAHVGALAVPLARRCREMVAFEANPATFRLLEINLQINRIENCIAHPLAVGEKPGEIEFNANTSNSGGSKRRPLVDDFVYRYDRPANLKIPMVSLDAFLEDHRFDLVLMDIEGSEFFALQGMEKVLRASRHLQIEYLPHHLANVSKASEASFAALLEPHFQVVVAQRDGRTCSADQLESFLIQLRESGFAGDLLLSKS